MDRLRIDLHFAARLLRRSPGWSAIAILSLALGIGANAVVFSLVDAVLLEPFPYRDSGQLVLLWGSKSETQTTGISGADLKDWREQNRTFEEMDAFLAGEMKFSLGASETDRVQAGCMGHRVLPMLGVDPALGRNFTEDEARFGATPVVLLSDALWRSRYASNVGIVGTAIRLDDKLHEVVGVMPPGFFFPDTDARLWVPAPCGLEGFERRGAMSLHAVGRVRPGVTVAEAQADLDRINRNLAKAYPDTNQMRSAGVFSLRRIVIGQYEQALWTLVWAIALVLLIACANVVHLQLARGVDRETELSVRGASGAGRSRLVRQLLTESFLLVAIAAVAGLFVAWVGVRLIHGFALTDIPRMEHARLDARVLAFTGAISVITALLSSVWPAWKASGVQISETLKLGATATTGASRSQVRDLLAVTEIAAAVTLLVASGLVVNSFVKLSRAEWGFNPENVLLIDTEMPRTAMNNRSYRLETTEAIRTRLRDLPGVLHVTAGYSAPIRWGGWSPRAMAVDGRVLPDATPGVWTVGRGYFTTIGAQIHEGRDFTEFDDAQAPQRAILSRSLAQQLWPNASALGKSIEILTMKPVPPGQRKALFDRFRQNLRGWPEDRAFYDVAGGAPWEVVGVVSDVRMFSLTIDGNPGLFIESRQAPASLAEMGLRLRVLLRTSVEPMSVAAAAKAQILAANRDLKFTEIVSLGDLVAQSIGGRGSNKLLLIVATIFGTLALSFATIGIYGVVAHNVTQRLREIGIRVALGAARADVVRIVMGYGLRLLLGGLALGVTAAWAATRGMKALLFATTPLDPITYAAVIATLTVAALLACALPLRRALRFDPVVLFKA
jgi:putative ABC transport system permease protein